MRQQAAFTNESNEFSKSLPEDLGSSQLGRELQDIFEHSRLATFFQPIVSLKKSRIIGFEALSRGPENSSLFSPANLFSAAIKHDLLLEMDLMARRIAIETFHRQAHLHQNLPFLFLNVSVSTLLNQNHQTGLTLQYLQAFDLDVSHVVIEITELQPVEDMSLFQEAISHYRRMGFKVAIDDLGSGYNGLKLWSEVKPDFVKVDKHFIAGIDRQADKYRFMETILTLAKGLGTKVIAEGVETESELRMLEKLGVDLVQGYLLKRPAPSASMVLDYDLKPQVQSSAGPTEAVKIVISPAKAMSPNTSVQDMTELMLKDQQLEFVPIVEQGIVRGMVWRRELMDVMARPFGYDLHTRKKITRFMDPDPLVFDANTPLVDVSRTITEQGNYERGHFVITEDGFYQGCGSFMEVLRVMTDLQVSSARYANPLSGLPGNVPIQNCIQDHLDQAVPFTVMYVDVDNFKPYNDYYSFEQGDQVISEVAKVLHSAVGLKQAFIGHVGGDDFVVVTRDSGYQAICDNILEGFSQAVAQFYTETDRQRGGIVAKNREGEERFFPMMSLSIGVLLVAPGQFDHTQKLSSCATRAKKGAKSEGGNTYFVADAGLLDQAAS
ncbi:MAG: GGDEF domain-containing protein [Hydrogenovibrio sp.]|uniref:GGDEF domain-containing protein n=1 Tax=Hydrogenovibrio sp. TaxID=2065821 RepID=UPI00286FF1AC|nr:GGDEF domain-containing protein [Hydrogenovibrio sp.]MDR9497999.1 GGDEF domain-containing protein [Hydrogenovibrio sp.]